MTKLFDYLTLPKLPLKANTEFFKDEKLRLPVYTKLKKLLSLDPILKTKFPRKITLTAFARSDWLKNEQPIRRLKNSFRQSYFKVSAPGLNN